LKEVTAGIIVKDNKVLIARRAPSEKLAGKWEFPGGKIEEHETPEECLARELKEELNITVNVADFFSESIYQYPNGEIKLLAYKVEWVGGDIALSVHDAFKFVNREELIHYDLAPADIPIANKLLNS
jgi:8-oxo-dGTP diphosphatase